MNSSGREMMRRELYLFELFRAGVTSDDVLAWLESGFRAWRQGGADTIAEGLGLPDNPATLARELRDAWLSEAARDLHEPRAVHLLAAIDRNLTKVKAWTSAGGPPDDATRAMLALYFAARSGAELPTSEKQLRRILTWDTLQGNVSAVAAHNGSTNTNMETTHGQCD